MADYTATGLITSIQKRGIFPNAQKTFQTTDFLRFMDEELRLHIVPFINLVRENYFTDLYDQTIVSGTSEYQMPPRAIGMKLKNVYFVDSNNQPFEVPRIDIDDLPSILTPMTSSQGIPRSFYFRDNTVNLVPVPNVTGTLRQYYYVRRNALVDTTAVGKITSIDRATGILTLNNVPSTFTTSATLDLIKNRPGFETMKMDVLPSAVGASSVTLSTSDIPAQLLMNDYVALSQESPIPQIPYEVFPLLAQRTVAAILRATNDLNGAGKAEAEVKSLEDSVSKLLSDRADEQSKKIVSANNIGNHVWGRFVRW